MLLKLRRTLSCIAMAAVAVSWAGEAQAQAPRALKYSEMGTPNLIFDTYINPTKIRLDTTPSPDAKAITQAHALAREQAYDAAAYLHANRRAILAGEDPIYNEVFGRYYDRSNPFYQAGEYQIDESHYARVINTFNQVKVLLDDTNFYSAGAPTDGGVLNRIKNGSGGFQDDQLGSPRGFRQWGYSNSRSEKHYKATTSGEPFFPLWVDDNETDPGRPAANGFPEIKPSEAFSFLFFKDKMTIYGDYADMHQQYVGIPFLTGLWDPLDLLDGRYRNRRLPLNPTPEQIEDFIEESINFRRPISYTLEDGTSVPLLMHNLILASFSEFTTDPFDIRGGMFHGLQEMFVNIDGSNASFLQGADAYNFSKFVDKLEQFLASQGKTLDIKSFPPAGKNVRFTPAVPTP